MPLILLPCETPRRPPMKKAPMKAPPIRNGVGVDNRSRPCREVDVLIPSSSISDVTGVESDPPITMDVIGVVVVINAVVKTSGVLLH